MNLIEYLYYKIIFAQKTAKEKRRKRAIKKHEESIIKMQQKIYK